MRKGSSEEFNQISTWVDLLMFRAAHQSAQTACQFLPDGEGAAVALSYGELDQMARAVATLLKGLNCGGEPVLLLYPPSLEYVVAFFGCLYAGAIAVPAYPPRPNRSLARLQVMIQDAAARVALTDGQVLRSLERRFTDFPELKRLQWLATDDLETTLADSWRRPDVTGETLAFLQYTSGSTGDPKGVKVSHGNLIHNSKRIYQLFGHSATSRGLSWLPPYHDMGLVGGILQPLYAGMQIVLMPPVAFLQKPLRWLQAISRYGSTTSGGPNFAYDLCVQRITPEQRSSLDLSTWKIAFSGAEPVRAETLERFADAFAPFGFRKEAFYPCYGMAETTLIVTGSNPATVPTVCSVDEVALRNHQVAISTDAQAQQVVSCGCPPADQRVMIVNPETQVPCPENTVGEIWVMASESVAQGYWHRPTQSQDIFCASTADGTGPCLRTGDLGFLRQGELFVTGRSKELIIIRGRNYYPKDIETSVESAHADLRPGAGAAFSITIEGQEHLVVVQEVKRTALRTLNGDLVVAAVRQAIAEAHDLQLYGLQLIKTGRIPKTTSGKIRRLACRSGFLDRQLAAVYTWQLGHGEEGSLLNWGDLERGQSSHSQPITTKSLPPVSPSEGTSSSEALQRWLVTWLAQQLRVSAAEIEVTRPFAEYGLDSVAAVELTDALQAVIHRPLSPTLAYEYPTIEAVAGYLGTQSEPGVPEADSSPESAQTEDELAQLLDDLETLSEAEVQELLEQQGR